MKVIIVDDNKDVTYSLRKGLLSISEDYEIKEANSGMECLELVKKDKPDIVLLDIMMPKMDGWAVAEVLKSRGIPILFITGKANMIEESKFRDIEYLLKPVDIKELDARIRKILKIGS